MRAFPKSLMKAAMKMESLLTIANAFHATKVLTMNEAWYRDVDAVLASWNRALKRVRANQETAE